MDKLKQIKQEIINNIKWGRKEPEFTGGQSCGLPHRPVTLRSEELDLEIIIGSNRSVLKNKKLAFILFKLALNKLIR